jgi:CubicO group peptidase (beta-lactamase class C family)
VSAGALVVHGRAEAGWEPVADAFRANFEAHEEAGAACCVYHDGHPVVDLWGGVADATTGREWTEDSVQLVLSTTKGASAVCAHMLAERGALDLDAPIAAVWPEFAANGKDAITLRTVMAHRAGLAAVDGDLSLDDVLAWEPVVAAIAAQAPNWPPGTRQGYHVRSYGFVVGEVVRRVTGRSLGQWFAAEVATPLGLDFWIGLPDAVRPRLTRVIPPAPAADPEVRALVDAFFAGDSLAARAMSGPSGLFAYDDMWNDAALLRAELPSSNGVSDARSVARLYAATIGDVDGVRLLTAGTVADATRVRSAEQDLVVGLPLHYGTGFALAPTIGLSAGPSAFGHPGAGGSLGLADPERALAVGYVMNRMVIDVDGRADSIVAAATRIVG